MDDHGKPDPILDALSGAIGTVQQSLPWTASPWRSPDRGVTHPANSG